MLCLAALSIATCVLGVNPYLERGRKLYDHVRYEEAEAQLRLAKESPSSTPEEKQEALDLLARSVVAQGKFSEASQLYRELLASNPNAPDPKDVSPKISEVFLQAKRRLFAKNFVRLNPLPAAPATLEVEVVDPWRSVDSVTLFEADEGATFAGRPLPQSGHRVAASISFSGKVSRRWYLEARNAEGKRLATLGTAEEPNWLRATPAQVQLPAPAAPAHSGEVTRAGPAEPPSRWPAWVLTATSLAAAGVGAALLVSAQGDYHASESALFASDSRASYTRYRQKSTAGAVCLGGAALSAGGAGLLFWRSNE